MIINELRLTFLLGNRVSRGLVVPNFYMCGSCRGVSGLMLLTALTDRK